MSVVDNFITSPSSADGEKLNNTAGLIIIIISLFQEDNIFGTNASLKYGPRLQR